jgi:hypothetical protein
MPAIPIRRLVLPLLTLAALSAWGQDGLRMREDSADWPRWQARVSLATTLARADLSLAPQMQSAQVLGDYYFAGPGFGAGRVGGGFRATSGVLLGSRSASLSTPAMASRQGSSFTLSSRGLAGAANAESDNHAMPYLGVGYTGVALRGGWGFSADVGIVGVSSGDGLNVGRSAAASQSLDDALRDLRLTPVLQLGVSYSF